MERIRRIAKHRTVRFGIVGVLNTGVNFAVLNAMFYAVGLNRYVASIIATAVAVLVSFILNRSFVFASQGRPTRQLALFIAVTVSGVMLVQNTVYVAMNLLLQGNEGWLVNLIHFFTRVEVPASLVSINVSNVFGSIAAMVWNYNGYRMFVFKDTDKSKKDRVSDKTTEEVIDPY